MKGATVLVFCCGIILASIALDGCAATKSGTRARVSAAAFCVGDAPITQAQLGHWSRVFAGMSPSAARPLLHASSFSTPRQDARQFLIAAARTTDEARQQGVEVSDAEARATLERLRYEEVYGSSGTVPKKSMLEAVLRPAVETSPDRLTIVRLVMLEERLEQRVLHDAELAVPRARLALYFGNHRRGFLIPERRDAAIIIAWKKNDIELAKHEIQAGKRLMEVLVRRDEEPGVGGIHRNLRRNHTPRLYEEDFFSAKPHVLVGPRKAEIYYMFEVLAVKAPKQQSLQEVEPVIRHRLITPAAHALLASASRALAARWPVRTHC
jgi:hypothetical protein